MDVINFSWKIEAKNLTVFSLSKKKPLLEKQSFEIKEKERLTIIGPSGSGKTTLAYALLGLLPKTLKIGGNLAFLGEARDWKIGQHMSMVFQDPHRALNPFLSVQAHLKELFKGNFFLQPRNFLSRMKERLEEVQLPSSSSFLKKYPHALSGGEKQRLVLLMALANNPKLLIADEPTTSLDFHLKMDLLHLLKRLQEQKGFTLVLLTHDPLAKSILSKRVLSL